MPVRALSGLLLLSLLLSACSTTTATGSAAQRGARPSRPTRPTASAPATQGSLVPPATQGSLVSFGDVHNVTFVRPKSAWALASLSTGTVVARSTDGGLRWHVWGAPLAAAARGFEPSLVVMLGGNGVGSNVADGVVTVNGSPTALVSTDRLVSWRTVRFPAPVLAVAADPGPGWSGGPSALATGVDYKPLWVLVGPLPANEHPAQAANLGPSGSLLEALLYPATGSWKPYGTLSGPAWTGRSSVSFASLVRLSATAGYAVVSGVVANTSVPGGFEQVALLEQTTDYGYTWSQLPIPCGMRDSEILLSPVSLGDLWLGCGGEPGAGNQTKVVYRSINAGRSWEAVWDGIPKGMDQGTIPMSSGYLAAVVALSPTDAYIGLGRGGLVHTADAGRTWQNVVPHIGGSGGIQQLCVLDRSDAWALVGGGRLWATANGRQWSQIAGPSG